MNGFDRRTDLQKNEYGVVELAGNKPQRRMGIERYQTVIRPARTGESPYSKDLVTSGQSENFCVFIVLLQFVIDKVAHIDMVGVQSVSRQPLNHMIYQDFFLQMAPASAAPWSARMAWPKFFY